MLDRIINSERRAEGKAPFEISITGTSVLATEGFNYLADAYAAAGNRDEATRQRALSQQLVLQRKLARIRELAR